MRRLLIVLVVLVVGSFSYLVRAAGGPGGVWLPWVMSDVTWPLATATATGTATATMTPSTTPTATGTATATRTPSPTATATTAPVADVRIVFIDEGDEYVRVRNVGTAAQVMTGWQIQSADGATCAASLSQVYGFPGGYVLAAGADVRVTSGPDAADAPPSVLRWTTRSIWNNSGDVGWLLDSSGAVVSRYAFGGCS